MEIKFFSDLIDAVGKVTASLRAIAKFPKAERETIRRTLDDTYRLIDTTLNMVIIRLGDILLQISDDDFLREAAKLDNYTEWMQAEREFRLCRSMRVALRETETLTGKIAGAVSTKDWDALLQHMQAILATEGEVALFISQEFQQLANDARTVGQDPRRIESARQGMRAVRESLLVDRQKLIKQEVSLFEIV